MGSFYTDRYEREQKRSDFDSAAKYFSEAIEICNGIKAFESMGPLYSNLGQLFYHSKDYSSSIFYYEKSIRVLTDSNNIVFSLLKIGAAKFGAKKSR
ncbi:MAG: tetratricopeptide repeat protein [Sphingobacteriaceae bacterium]|nr:tetratricopeptide repeat protein [Sphingobacteriaceae bacterium]